jgi:hypothetical protein
MTISKMKRLITREMSFTIRLMLFGFAVCALVAMANGSLISVNGSSPGFWDDQAVILAQVVEAKTANRDESLKLALKTVVLTTWPINVSGDLNISGPLNAPDSAASANVRDGDLVLCCMRHDSDDGWKIERNALSFMPRGSSVIVLKSLQDPILDKILKEIRSSYIASTKQRPS